MENKKRTTGNGHEGKMSRQQAGHLGGVAPHSCRGRECEQGASNSSHSSAHKNSSNRSQGSNEGNK